MRDYLFLQIKKIGEFYSDCAMRCAGEIIFFCCTAFLAHLAFGRERGLQFFVHAGPQIGFLIGESETIEGIDMNTLSNTQKAIYGVKIQNKFDYGITGGGGGICLAGYFNRLPVFIFHFK